MTQGEKIVELEQRVKFLERIIYGLATLMLAELLGLFFLWVKDIFKL